MGFFDDIFSFLDDAWTVVDDYIIQPIFGGGDESVYNTLIKPVAQAGVEAYKSYSSQGGSQGGSSSRPPGYIRSSVNPGQFRAQSMSKSFSGQGVQSVDPKEVHAEWDSRMRSFAYYKGIV